MALEMGKADDHVGVGKGTADFRLLDVFGPLEGNQRLVRALQAVGDDDLASGGDGVEAVEVGGIHVFKGVLPGTDVQGVAVGQEGFASEALDQVGDHLGVVGPEEGKVACLAKVKLDGDELVGEIDLRDTCRAKQFFQFGETRDAPVRFQIAKIDIACHSCS